MEINPYESRLRMLQQIDGVQMQREAAPDEETAGCPGCPYFWTCPVPHRGEEVKAPVDIEFADVEDVLGPRTAYAPRDESDVGWTDDWVDEDGLRIEEPDALELPAGAEDLTGPAVRASALKPVEPVETVERESRTAGERTAPEHTGDPSENAAPAARGRRRASRWNLFGRR